MLEFNRHLGFACPCSAYDGNERAESVVRRGHFVRFGGDYLSQDGCQEFIQSRHVHVG